MMKVGIRAMILISGLLVSVVPVQAGKKRPSMCARFSSLLALASAAQADPVITVAAGHSDFPTVSPFLGNDRCTLVNALSCAASSCNVDGIAQLLSYGVQSDAVNSGGKTAHEVVSDEHDKRLGWLKGPYSGQFKRTIIMHEVNQCRQAKVLLEQAAQLESAKKDGGF